MAGWGESDGGLSPRESATAAEKADPQWARTAFHVASMTLAMLYFYFSDRAGGYILAGVGTLAVLLDLARVYGKRTRALVPAFLERMVRPEEERRLSAISGFVAAAVLVDVAVLWGGLSKDIVLAAVGFAAVGDPAARLVGTTWGRIRILGTHKTLEGSLAFFVAGLLAARLLCLACGASFSWSQLIVGGLVATTVELVSTSWDNFNVPFWSTAAMGLFVGVGAL